ncbi:MAG TPA: hypothetical protein VLH10_11075 [Yinghuangia sp.]|uniref:hypothetical protein n=1 Tax=Yinghuangia sp. YIM S10712 TaxID=3436930 RepID=UPI002CC45B45|nr:hypothetical protein [Yinghuangia sp.]
MRIRRIAVATSAAVLAALSLGACSDDEEKDNTKTEGPALAAEAIEAMNKIKFLDNNGTTTDEDGKTETIKACAVMATKAVKGTTEKGGEKVEQIQVGGFYYTKTSGKGWAHLIGEPDNAALEQGLDEVTAGKWVKSEMDEGDETIDFFDNKTDDVTKGEVMEFRGKKVVPLMKTAKNGAKKTYYVAAKGDPVIVGQIEEGPEPKERSESVITKADNCDAVEPPADQVVEDTEVNKTVAQLRGE